MEHEVIQYVKFYREMSASYPLITFRSDAMKKKWYCTDTFYKGLMC